MTGKKWYRLGVWLLVFGVVLMLVGVFFGYRYLVELPIPAVLHDPLEEAAGAGRIGGALKTGRYIQYPPDTTLTQNNLLVSLCHVMGLTRIEKIGNLNDSRGPIPDLFA